MLVQIRKMLAAARKHKFAVGAFNIYNLEGALAVVRAARDLSSPVIIQLLPSALDLGGSALVRLCLEAGRQVEVPVCVHLDHCASQQGITTALSCGITSVMADGSMLDHDANILFTRRMVQVAKDFGAGVEAELGRIAGSEDAMTVREKQARMTDPDQAKGFVSSTGIDALAVCIGNVHGKYKRDPDLDFNRLAAIGRQVKIPLVLHGTSGLPDSMILESVRLGVCKFNVNTEIRSVYLKTMETMFDGPGTPELVDIMTQSISAMTGPVKKNIELFGSAGMAGKI